VADPKIRETQCSATTFVQLERLQKVFGSIASLGNGRDKVIVLN
jgi:hypothetical protein